MILIPNIRYRVAGLLLRLQVVFVLAAVVFDLFGGPQPVPGLQAVAGKRVPVPRRMVEGKAVLVATAGVLGRGELFRCPDVLLYRYFFLVRFITVVLIGVFRLLDELVKTRQSLLLHFKNARLKDLLLRRRVVANRWVDRNLLRFPVQEAV